MHSIDDTGWLDTLKQKQTDLSSGRWIYLVILLVLICEQAMAVRLSHHQRPEDLEAFAPSAAAAFAHGTPPSGRRGRTQSPRRANGEAVRRNVTRQATHDMTSDEQAMNPTEPTKETEFVFRRLGDSFLQFTTDSVAFRADTPPRRRGDSRCRQGRGTATSAARPRARQAGRDGQLALVGAFLSVAALVDVDTVAFYKRDSEQVKAGPASLSETGTTNDAMWYSFVAAVFGVGSVFVV